MWGFQDILHAFSRSICTGYVSLLDELSLQVILLAIKSFDDLAPAEVVKVMTDYNEYVPKNLKPLIIRSLIPVSIMIMLAVSTAASTP